jgi:hypothetical protein
MWSGAVSACEASQIRAFSVTAHHLADLVLQVGGDEGLAERMRSGSPTAVSAALGEIDGTETAQKVGSLVHDHFERRLVSEASRLRRLLEGENAPASSIAAFYRLKVIDQLAVSLRSSVTGNDEKDRNQNAGIHAAIAANEALSYADRYLISVGHAQRTTPADRKKLLLQIRYDIQRRARAELVPEMLLAFDTYLNAAGLGGDLK